MDSELWTGAVAEMPSQRPPLDLFGWPTTKTVGGAVVIELRGYVAAEVWFQLAWKIDQALKAGAEKLVVVLSSRASVATGCLVACSELEMVSQKIPTVAHCIDAIGAVFAVAKCCREVFVESPKSRVGIGSAAWRYGAPDAPEPPFPAESARLLLEAAAYETEGVLGTRVAAPVLRKKLNAAQATHCLMHLSKHIEAADAS